MSQFSSSVTLPLASLLSATLSSDNATRKFAEEDLQQRKVNQPDALTQQLLGVIQDQNEPEDLRVLAGTLLRRFLVASVKASVKSPGNVSATSQWSLLSPSTHQFIKTTLLHILQGNAVSKKVLMTVVDTTADVGVMLLRDHQWDELLPLLFNWVSGSSSGMLIQGSSSPHLRETSIRVLRALTVSVQDVLVPHFPSLCRLLLHVLSRPTSLSDTIESLHLSSALLHMISDDVDDDVDHSCHHSLPSFHDMVAAIGQVVPLMLTAMDTLLAAGDIDYVIDVIEVCLSLAQSPATILRPHIESLSDRLETILSDRRSDDSCRQLAIEFFLTLFETHPTLVRKHIKGSVVTVCQVSMRMMLSIGETHDDVAWRTAEDDVDELSSFSIGREALDRLAIAIGGKTVMPIVFTCIKGYLADTSDWCHRCVGLIAIAQIAEGCNQQLVDRLDSIVHIVVQHLGDSHPRVRHAAIEALGQLATDFASVGYSDRYGSVVLPALVLVMDDVSAPRVQSHAAAAVINVVEGIDAKVLEGYAEILLMKLLSLLQHSPLIVQETTVTSIASVVHTLDSLFIPYYSLVAPYMVHILSQSNIITTTTLSSPSSSIPGLLLQGKTIECVTMMAVAVGDQFFIKNDGDMILTLIVNVQTAVDSSGDASDPRRAYLQEGWVRLCSCLKHAFAPYLTYCLPSVLASAAQPVAIIVSDEDQSQDQNENNDSSFELFMVDGRLLRTSTNALEEKTAACALLRVYLSVLGHLMMDYVPRIAETLLPLVTGVVSDSLRDEVARCLPALIRATILFLNHHHNSPSLSLSTPSAGYHHHHSHSDNIAAVSQSLMTLIQAIMHSLCMAIKEEIDIGKYSTEHLASVCVLLGAVAETIKESKGWMIDDDNSTTITTTSSTSQSATMVIVYNVMSTLTTVWERVLKRRRKREGRVGEEGGEYDEEQAQVDKEYEQHENQVLDAVGDSVNALTLSTPNIIYHLYFITPIPLAVVWMALLKRGLGGFCYPLLSSATALASIIHHLLSLTHSHHPSIRQAACYALGIAGTVTSQVPQCPFISLIDDVVKALGGVIVVMPGTDKMAGAARDNAISALGKVAEAYESKLERDWITTWRHFFHSLPLTSDYLEAHVVYALVCRLLMRRDTSVIGISSTQDIIHIATVLCTQLGTSFMTDEVTAMVVIVLSQVSKNVHDGVWNKLSDKQKIRVSAAINNHTNNKK